MYRGYSRWECNANKSYLSKWNFHERKPDCILLRFYLFMCVYCVLLYYKLHDDRVWNFDSNELVNKTVHTMETNETFSYCETF